VAIELALVPADDVSCGAVRRDCNYETSTCTEDTYRDLYVVEVPFCY
jgi:hypothetical protein